MSVREEVLGLFERNKGVYLSGEELAGRLSVSRAAVWKAVKALQGEGYAIDAVTNRGYRLSERSDLLSAQGIKKYLSPECGRLNIEVYPALGSTNTLLRERAEAGAPEGTVIIAASQQAGRGRMGRQFYSPPGTGLYMSLLLRPTGFTADRAVRFTTLSAVAVCEAIERVSGERAEIKWINDVLVRGKKVCGILTEASFGLENGLLEYAVLGLGINVFEPEGGFPDELAGIAGAVFQSPAGDVKNRLAGEFLNRFMGEYARMDSSDYVARYRERSLVVGRAVSVITAAGAREALALDIDGDCGLRVLYDGGEEATLSSGEVSVRV